MGMALLKDWHGRFYKVIENLYQFIILGVKERNMFHLKFSSFILQNHRIEHEIDIKGRIHVLSAKSKSWVSHAEGSEQTRPIWGASGLCCWALAALCDMPRGKLFWKWFAVGFAHDLKQENCPQHSAQSIGISWMGQVAAEELLCTDWHILSCWGAPVAAELAHSSPFSVLQEYPEVQSPLFSLSPTPEYPVMLAVLAACLDQRHRAMEVLPLCLLGEHSLRAGETLGQVCGCLVGWRRLPLHPAPSSCVGASCLEHGEGAAPCPKSLYLPLKLLLAGHTGSVWLFLAMLSPFCQPTESLL